MQKIDTFGDIIFYSIVQHLRMTCLINTFAHTNSTGFIKMIFANVIITLGAHFGRFYMGNYEKAS